MPRGICTIQGRTFAGVGEGVWEYAEERGTRRKVVYGGKGYAEEMGTGGKGVTEERGTYLSRYFLLYSCRIVLSLESAHRSSGVLFLLLAMIREAPACARKQAIASPVFPSLVSMPRCVRI